MSTSITTSTAASLDQFPLLSLVMLVLLFILIVVREMMTGIDDSRVRNLQQTLNIIIFPLMIVFMTIILTRLLEIVQ